MTQVLALQLVQARQWVPSCVLKRMMALFVGSLIPMSISHLPWKMEEKHPRFKGDSPWPWEPAMCGEVASRWQLPAMTVVPRTSADF